VIGKAEASSAGEQLARNNLSDWNGQLRSERIVLAFIVPFQKFMPSKTQSANGGCYKKQSSINSAIKPAFQCSIF
jgi:hypothetical protein